MSIIAYIALGSNQGDRRAHLDQALQALQKQAGITVTRVSNYHETEPMGGPPAQQAYLNAAAELHTDLTPGELLRALLEIEQSLGRERRERYGPRTVDLDLLLYGNVVRQEPDVIVPHPRMHERRFVLQPLSEIAPHAVHPVLGTTVAELLRRLPAAGPSGSGPPQAAGEGQPGIPRQGQELIGHRVLVTGSSRGIGRAIALELALAGADVLIHGRHAAPAEATANDIRAAGVRTRVLLADLSRPEECRRLVQRAWEEWNGLDIWINNAGADTLTGEAASWTFERKLAELLALDVTATILLARDVGARMKATAGGVLLNMGWDQAETGMEGDSGQLFAASKAAVMAFSKSLSVMLAPQVRVNCLAPGWIRTAWGEKASTPWQERVLRETPLGRWGTPADVALAARWLVSPTAAFITGQVIRVNGGAVR
jgi:3-oxoacyl-[acyl-carrier protein] reductase